MDQPEHLLEQAQAKIYLDPLHAPSAEVRLAAIDRLEDEGVTWAIPQLRELLGDTSPFVLDHGGRVFVGEVRARALSALEALYRLGGRKPDFGPLAVRKAMPAGEVAAKAALALGRLDMAERSRVLAEAEQILDQRVQPLDTERPLLRDYLILQALDLVDYRLEEVDPLTYLTPLQAEVLASQVQSQRPLPHLRLAAAEAPTTPLGFVYRDIGGRWTLDFREDTYGQQAAAMVQQILRGIDRRGVPRVQRTADGSPRRNADGSYILNGVVPLDTPAPRELLDNLRLFLPPAYQAILAE
ncbi:MAG TPA: hypothetical protein VFS21_34390 [Roseiflexaceae bacterium]|nr:hypothetical protein [Roseiflexaceae bacterium]